MKLTELFEQNKITNPTHVVWSFGRFSVPHRGHSGLIRIIIKTAKTAKCNWRLFASKTHDSQRNPLTYAQKVSWLYKLFPVLKGHLVEDENVRTYLQAAEYLYKKGFRSATIVVGEDDIDNIRDLLTKYNSIDEEGNGYKFAPITFIPAPRITSATIARLDVANNDPAKFQKDTGVDPSLKVDGETLFQAIKYGLS
jgi:hypothetical protein